MKINMKITVCSIAIAMLGVSCSFLDPDNEAAKYDDEAVWSNAKYAEGVLLKSYRMLSSNYNSATDWSNKADMACDDATVNVASNAAITMSTGGWTSRSNPTNLYNNAYTALYYLNLFLANVDNVQWWQQSDVKTELYKRKLKGEAFALRAWWSAMLLKNHGGIGENGTLLGYPIVTELMDDLEAAKKPRNTYAECVEQIIKDCDDAIALLPDRWSDNGLDPDEKDVFGIRNINRINALSVKLLKSRVALFAASPAFAASGTTWSTAVNYALEVMTANNGISSLHSKDMTFWVNADDAYLNAQQEILWYASRVTNNSNTESLLLPPTLFGKGFVNPSQSFVDCFGDKDGYPISESDVYSSSNPYANRDPRFAAQLFFDGATRNSATINVRVGAGNDAIGAVATSTRTGYYLRKFTDDKVSLASGNIVHTPHYFAYARYTEALLNFAEAANQAGGPDEEFSGYTARSVVDAIRKRAGINSTEYVASLDKEKLHQLILNERRIELSFENSRFWDIRRWNMALNNDIQGVVISADGTTRTPLANPERRTFDSYMIYPPIPYNETLKYNIIQNKGW